MRNFRLLIFLCLLDVAGSSLATGQLQTPDGRGALTGPIHDSTYRFFPQIAEAIEQEPISPANPKLSPGIMPGPANSLSVQSLTSSTQTVAGTKFPGITFTGFVPPDPNIAVSPTHIVQVVNVTLAFFDKSGNKQFQQSLGSSGFFQPVAQTTFVFDPKVIYDQGSKRFFIVALEQADNPQASGILLAVSDDSDPNGNWTKYRINTKVSKGGTNYWLDYPGLGYNKDGLVITGNMFSFANAFGFARSYAIQKAGLLAGSTANFAFFDHTNEFTIQPSKTLESVATRVYGVRIRDTTTFEFYSWSGIATATPVLNTVNVSIPAFIQLPFSFYAPSSGGGSLDALADRMMDATFRSGYLVCAHTVATSAAKDRSMVRWYEFSMGSWPASGSPTRRQSGNISLAAPNSLLMPAISRNGTGAIALVVTRCSPTRPADLYGTSHRSTDPLNSMGPLGFLASSGHAPVPQSRWGDYHSMVTDPSDSKRFWTCGEVLATTGQWRTEMSTWIVP